MFPLTTTGEGSYANGRGEEVAVKGRDEGWKGGRKGGGDGRRWSQVRRKRRECRHIYPGRTVRYLATGPLFFGSSGNLLQCKLFFLLASGFLFFFGARVRVE